MNNQATLEKMNSMRLYGMAHAFQSCIESGMLQDITADELTAHLVDAEWDDRQNRTFNRLVRNARFRYQASVEHLNFKIDRNLNKNMIMRFTTGDWIRKSDNIIITGPTGTGKSYVASALGFSACTQGVKVYYTNCMKLFSEMKQAQVDGTYERKMLRMQKMDLLIFDDFGLKPMDMNSRLLFLELLEDRYGCKATIICTQIPVSKWFDIIGDPTIADAICDRVVHNAHKIELKGGSMRKKKQKDT